jgi:ABC-type glycerol-3-phosphate transport system substrate-binding protein
MAFLLFAAGAGHAAGSPEKRDPAAANAPVKLQLFHYMGEQYKRDALEKLTQAITRAHPEITFEITGVAYAQFQPLLQTKIAAGDVPDLMTGRPQNSVNLVEAGVFMDLTNELFVKNVQPQALKEQQVNGRYYSVPIDFTAFGVAYNKEMFDKYGLKVPTTLSEMIKVCDTFKANGIVPFAHPYKDANQPGVELGTFFVPMCYLNDKDVYWDLMKKKRTWTQIPLVKQAFEIFFKYLEYTDPGDIAVDPTTAINMFASGKRPMIMIGLWSTGDIRRANPNGKFGYFATPWSEDPKQNLLPFSVDDSFVVSASSKYPKALLAALEFIASEQGTKVWTDSTNLMSTSVNGMKIGTNEEMILDAYRYFDKGLGAYRADVRAFSGEASAKFRTMMQWMVSLPPKERTMDKVLAYFEKEFSTLN